MFLTFLLHAIEMAVAMVFAIGASAFLVGMIWGIARGAAQ
jgi:hypothetical protein